MEESLRVLEVAGYLIATVALVWLIKIVITLKSAIESQKSVIDSLTTHADYVGGLQSTVSKLYDPTEIEKIIDVKVQSEILEREASFNRSEKNSIDSFNTLLSYVSISTVYLSDISLEAILKGLKGKYDADFLAKYARHCRQEVLKVRHEELEKYEKTHNK
ncbi:hypothetical protein BGP77_11095 [Saccharospirillum sp. MSK14-1]|uniref:hypothetical protein n=1 Tax=Saccharospirillum sp. MSK14-1 TaxID=1897632 RepID=UPI000D3562F9|nr:hypothetical protein [Saccharospirillum sp. MSK14-1]PTY38718.1 hypothetical protein BGP77_11095 [Saccharospirillum sp. MSK14-1]